MAKRYSIFVVPKGRGNVRRFEIGIWSILTILIFVFSAIGGLVTLSVDGQYYKQAYLDTRSLSNNPKNEVNIANSNLSDVLGRLERLAANINEAIPSPSGTAIGPVDEEEWLPNPQITKDQLKKQGSRWQSPFANLLSKSFSDLSPDEMLRRAEGAEEKLAGLVFTLNNSPRFWASIPSLWPVRGWVTAGFADRRRTHLHQGIDIAAPIGTAVYSPGDGVVTFAGYRQGYGKVLVVDHGFGLATLYGHCSALYLSEGDVVRRGMIIAAVGNTGRSTGPHLHYEIQVYGLPVNPLRYIAEGL